MTPIYHLVFPQNGFKAKTWGFMRRLLSQSQAALAKRWKHQH